MGITAVSPANLSAPAKGATSPLSADSAGGADFAALLTQQFAGPTLLEMALQPAIGTGKELDPKDGMAKLLEDDASSEDNPNALLGLAGLLPGLADIPKPIQPATDAGGSAKAAQEAGKEPLAGIIGELNGQAANDERKSAAIGADAKQDPAAALANEGLGKETAIIAADSEPGSGNGQNFAATLASHATQGQRPQAGSESSAATVRTPLHDSRWGQDFGEKVVWLAKNDQQVARININPPQLGPMQITLNVNGDQASALFVSPHAEVRQAIQDAMPQLREMLAGAGINLGQANVGTQLPQQNNGPQPQFSAPSRSGDDNAILRADNEQGTSAPLSAVHAGRGMVDLFA